MKATSQRSLLFRQNVNRTNEEWAHFLDGYRDDLIEFDMKTYGDDFHTAEDIVEEIFLSIIREPTITNLRPQVSFRRTLITLCMQKHTSVTRPWRNGLMSKVCEALRIPPRTLDDVKQDIAAGFLDLVQENLMDQSLDGSRSYIEYSKTDLRRWRKLHEAGDDAKVKDVAKTARADASVFGKSCKKVDAAIVSQVKKILKREGW